MVKAYLRYEPSQSFGVISSSSSNVVYDRSGKLIISASLENVSVWNAKLGTAVKSLVATTTEGNAVGEITNIACAPIGELIAVGHADGSIRIWDHAKAECLVTFNGHKRAVSVLRYNASGSLLASGGRDTDIVLWDTVGETGLFRLKGHRDQVTDLVFLETGSLLVSSSKDSLVRVWDLDTQCCVQTVVGHRGEVWALAVDPREERLVTGSVDRLLRVYSIHPQATPSNTTSTADPSDHLQNEDPQQGEGSGAGEGKDPLRDDSGVLRLEGSMTRPTLERVVTLAYSPGGDLLGVQGAAKALEIWRIRSEAEIMKKVKRRKKRQREKASKAGGAAEEEEEEVSGGGVSDEMEVMQVLRSKAKIRSFAFSQQTSGKTVDARVALSLHNNTLEVHELTGPESSALSLVDLPGHRHDVRALALASDDTMLLSCSHTQVKLWNPRSGICLRSVASEYGLSCLFTPGNRHAVIGCKSGALQLLDVGAATIYHTEEGAHDGAVWSLAALKDDSGFVSGSADHTVKFWEYELVPDEGDEEEEEEGEGEGGGGKRAGGMRKWKLMVRHTRTLQMTDDVLSVKLDPKSKFLAVALLDATVKVFFVDSLKFFLSLYGHKLPAVAMDISSDGSLLATGGADKNVKLWGMDFGDCHKSLFAHNDTVMQVQFVRKTHYLFTVGKDKVVKYWDCDKFEPLLTLEGHKAEVWCLQVSSYGDFVITGSHDRSIRRWDRTEEPFFIEEEQEKRLESLFEEGAESSLGGGGGGKEGDEENASGAAGVRSMETLTAADRITEALDLVDEEARRETEHQLERSLNPSAGAKLPPNPLLLGLSPSEYVLKAIQGVPSAELEQALLIIPFTTALNLIPFITDWLQNRKQVELSVRVACLLVRVHHPQLTSTAAARKPLLALQEILRPRCMELKDTIGTNIAALRQVQRISSQNATF